MSIQRNEFACGDGSSRFKRVLLGIVFAAVGFAAGCGTPHAGPGHDSAAGKSEAATPTPRGPAGLERTRILLEAAASSSNPRVKLETLKQAEFETEGFVRGEYRDQPEAWMQLGSVRFALATEDGSLAMNRKAAEAFETCLKLAPDHQQAIYYLAMTYERIGSFHWRTDMKEAGDAYALFRDTARRLTGPEHAGMAQLAAVKHADTCWHLGRKEQAMAHYEELYTWSEGLDAASEGQASALLGLGAAFQVTGMDAWSLDRRAEAIQHWQRSVALAEKTTRDGPRPLQHEVLAGMLRLQLSRVLVVALCLQSRNGEVAACLDGLEKLQRQLAARQDLPPEEAAFVGVQLEELRKVSAALTSPVAVADDIAFARVESLRRVALSLMQADLALFCNMARPLLTKALALHRALPQGLFRVNPASEAALRLECALADEAAGLTGDAMEHYRQVVTLCRAWDKDGADRLMRQWLQNAEDALKSLEKGPRSPAALQSLAMLTLDNAIANASAPALPGASARSAPPGPSADPRLSAEAELQYLNGEIWSQYRVRMQDGGREYMLRVTSRPDR